MCALVPHPWWKTKPLPVQTKQQDRQARREKISKPRQRQHLVSGGALMGVVAVVLALVLPSHDALNRRLVNRSKLAIEGSRQ